MKPLKDLIAARGREWYGYLSASSGFKDGVFYTYQKGFQYSEKIEASVMLTEAAHADKLRAALLVAVEALDKNLSQRTRGYPTPKEWEENWIICNEAKKKIKEIMEGKS